MSLQSSMDIISLGIPNASTQTPSSHVATASCTSLCKYDVFLSFRGEDTWTFVDHLYSSLKQHLIVVYKDDEALPRGDSVNQSLFDAIEGSQMAIIVLSKNYVDSSWCLEELAHIMKCRDERELVVMPIFCDVDPIEVRKLAEFLERAFTKPEAENILKTESWRKALVDASNILGWELNNIVNGHESKVIKEIVDAVSDKLFSFNSEVDEELVGMRARMQDLELQLDIGSDGVLMVGIWGYGGSGKTTLATSVCMKISQHFEGHCILANVRVESRKVGLKKMQENMLSAFFKREVKIHSVTTGKQMIKSMLSRRKVLVLLDDIDNIDQLEALAGRHSWFGSGSRVIITTRNEYLLKAHKVDKVCPARLLSHEESMQLFSRYTCNNKALVKDYETLSLKVLSYVHGLPLALKEVGIFLYDKDEKEWLSTLERLRRIPDMTIMENLEISFDGLESYEKDLFLDIACFWRGESKDKAMEILEGCGYRPEIGIKILTQRALAFINEDGKFVMHDLAQEMGHYIVRGEHPINPEKHSRVWIKEEIRNMCFGDVTMENDKIEAISYNGFSYDHSSRFCVLVSNMKKLRWLKVNMEDEEDEEEEENEKVEEHDGVSRFLSDQLWYIDWEGYPASPFRDSLSKLVVLRLDRSKQKEIWKGYKHLPYMKALELRHMNKLLSTPDFEGLPHLQKLILCDCDELEEIHPSLGYHKSIKYVRISHCPKLRFFPTIFLMGNLKTLKIEGCGLEDGEIPSGIGLLSNLLELDLSMNNFSRLDFSLLQLTRLKVFNLSWCNNLIELPKLPSSLAILKADYCNSLTNVGDCFRNCRWLCQVSLMAGSVINDGGRLLLYMLEGEAFENRSMLLQLKDLSVPNGVRTPLHKGSSCRLRLSDNWGSDFSGFLMCAVFVYDFHRSDLVRVSMNEVMRGLNFEDDVVWKESDSDRSTWIWYVSFASLRHTTWWNQTYKAALSLSFNIQDDNCSGLTATLVRMENIGGSRFGYTPNYFKIEQDSMSDLVLSLSLHYQ